ncbi:lysozyme inhibitor LprI family protein [Marilutibacter chinensis]|uniref:Lysozyme inhibitor LprI family protein n=1 Tax=Marilutibacter chinensis TaxID=2912247 RepID=A0ABS9HV16_9GAMM|nr:lysozyme inhibitor LprI family protein [Lysobacter chinensis]MCF7222210.1 lysozyme inhibitor LprI family protein [Lysobacter chinensis]
MEEGGEAITQAEMNERAYAMYARADNELASTVIEKMATYSPEEAAAFQQAQDAWIRWRDAESRWESKVWEGGTIRPLMVATRLESLTRERIAAIRVSGDLERDPNRIFAPYRKTPKDLPDHLSPGITGERVRQLLGVPHYVSENYWFYRFSDTQLQLKVQDEVVAEFAFVMIEGEAYETTLENVGPFHFGQLTFGDLSRLYPQLEFIHRFGARTGEFCIELPLGAVNTRYFFGSISTESGGRLLRASDANDEGVDESQAQARMLVNWFGRTHGGEPPYIWWHI